MGIWIYSKNLPEKIDERFQLSKNEGSTPIQLLKFKDHKILLKREDLNPTGSHKDRGLAYQISAHLRDEEDQFVISSSGNASISAINLIKDTPYKLTVFLSPKLNRSKLARLQSVLGSEVVIGKDAIYNNIFIQFSNRAKSDAFKFANNENAVFLRGSTDKYASAGYMTISFELREQSLNISDIFIPTSSGTTALGIFEGFDDPPRIHVCQTTAVNTLVRGKSNNFTQSKSSIVDSIVDKVGHRKNEIDKILKKNGFGWVISDTEILSSEKFLLEHNIKISYEGLLAFSSYIKALENNVNMENPVIIISGSR